MVWGKKRKREAELVEQQNLKAIKVAKDASWVRSTSSKDIEKMFDGFTVEIQYAIKESQSGMLSLDKDSRKTVNQLHGDLKELRKTWLSIDVNLATDEEAHAMHTALYTIPGILDIFKARVADCYSYIESAYTQGSSNRLRYHRISQLSLDIYGFDVYEGWEEAGVTDEQNKSVRDQLATLSHVLADVKEKQKDRTPDAAPEAKNAFRAADYSKDRELASTLMKLEKLWKQASQITHSIEDRYFLDEALERYVPDALNTYASFIHVPNAAKQEARRMLFQQLSLIEKELRRLARASVTINLQQMQAQVDFLKMKVED